MPPGDRGPRTSGSARADAAFLARAEHRVPLLSALAEEPRHRRELEALTDVSRTTVGRSLRAMEERRWVRREGDRYVATPLGAYVAGCASEFVECLRTERRLRDVWDLLPIGEDGVDVAAFSGAEVTVASADDPYAPVNRWVSLLAGSDRLRFVGSDVGLFEPCKDDLRRFILEGMSAAVVDPPEHARHIRQTYPELVEDIFASGNVEVRVHDDLPGYGIGVLDDRVVVCGFHPRDGTARVLVDTGDPAVREWALATFETYYGAARPFPEDSAAPA